ncbi:MAG: hypothetical protein M1493_04380 [Firmicutes bacterium]|nr:hypothetical protein [Bacillota bacterium]
MELTLMESGSPLAPYVSAEVLIHLPRICRLKELNDKISTKKAVKDAWGIVIKSACGGGPESGSLRRYCPGCRTGFKAWDYKPCGWY